MNSSPRESPILTRVHIQPPVLGHQALSFSFGRTATESATKHTLCPRSNAQERCELQQETKTRTLRNVRPKGTRAAGNTTQSPTPKAGTMNPHAQSLFTAVPINQLHTSSFQPEIQGVPKAKKTVWRGKASMTTRPI